ncbi:MAG TPA: N-acetylmuramoyl-L-alanine amidase, partial [Cyanothece sp. UBA12306]|nr:N-acetylmuramoyl-L-alanine amidase [Cyanothece sp. UBA12306]
YKNGMLPINLIFPLEIPVPITVQQDLNKISLILHNTTAKTDTISVPVETIIKNFTWQQLNTKQIKYTFELKTNYQWGYDLKYEGTNLIFSLRYPPKISSSV